MKDLLSVFPEELEALLLSVGEPKYRAKQMFPQLHKGLSPEDMTNIGKKTREKLGDLAKTDEDVLSYIAFPNLAEKYLEDRKAKEENVCTYSIVEC